MTRPDIHLFQYNDKKFMFDINTCETFEITPITYQVLQDYGLKKEEDIIKEMASDYQAEAVIDVFKEISIMIEKGYLSPYRVDCFEGVLPSHIEYSHPLEMVLLVSQQCNLNCKYCFAGKGEYGQRSMMKVETAIRAVDYLLERSEEMKKRMLINFFGGEPFLNFSVVQKTAEYISEINRKKGTRIHMGITTNGTILNNEILDCLKKHNITVVVSIDGPREIHDKWRKFHNGKGTYDTVVKNVRRMNEYIPKGVVARATISKASPPLTEISKHIKDLGFVDLQYEIVNSLPSCNSSDSNAYKDITISGYELENFYDTTNKTIETIIKGTNSVELTSIDKDIVLKNMFFTDGRGKGQYNCSAIISEIAVGTEGDIYPCQRFVNKSAFKLGDVWKGLDGERFTNFINDFNNNRLSCKKCWGRNICGRGCFHEAVKDGSFDEPDERACAIKLKLYERRLYIQLEIREHMPELIEKHVDPRSE
jgi:radical SAM additional 4Fe4S-binding domain